jgi:hypothetical protein
VGSVLSAHLRTQATAERSAAALRFGDGIRQESYSNS